MSVPEQQLPTGIEAPQGQGPQLDAFNSPQNPETITAPQLQQTMDPQNSTLPLQQEMQKWQQNQQLPNYDKTIQAILNVIENACNVGGAQTLALDKQAKAVQELAAAAHYLAQAAQQEGEHIPAAIQVRLQGAQLDMQMQKQAQDMALAHQQQIFDQQQTAQQNQHQQLLQQQDQQHRQQLEREKHQADLHAQAHGLVMNEQQAQQQAQQAEAQQGLAEAQATHQAQLAEQDQQHSHKLQDKQAQQPKPQGGTKK